MLEVARRKAQDAYWWVRHRVWLRDRYHVVRTGLPPGYYDPCTRILHATMNDLVRFVDYERGPKGMIAWDATEEHAAAWKEMQEIRDWWAGYLEHAAVEPLPSDYKAYFEREDELENEADVMLARLAKVRQHLWYA